MAWFGTVTLSRISNMEEATPIKLGVHAFHVNLYLHQFLGEILWFLVYSLHEILQLPIYYLFINRLGRRGQWYFIESSSTGGCSIITFYTIR